MSPSDACRGPGSDFPKIVFSDIIVALYVKTRAAVMESFTCGAAVKIFECLQR